MKRCPEPATHMETDVLANVYCVMYRLAVACYLYYLSEVEILSLVPKRAKNLADFLLSSDKFKSQFTYILERTHWKEIVELYTAFFDKTLEELLHHYELYKDGQVKTLVIDSTVDVFSIFVQSYIADYHRLGTELVENTDYKHLKSQILRFLEGNNRVKTKETFINLYNLLLQ